MKSEGAARAGPDRGAQRITTSRVQWSAGMRSALSTPSSDDSGAADLAAYAGLLRDSSAGGTTLAAIFVQRVFR